MVKILERMKPRVMDLPAPNGLGKTLRANSGPYNVVLRPFRMFSLAQRVQPTTMIGFKQIEFFDHTRCSFDYALRARPSENGPARTATSNWASESKSTVRPSTWARMCMTDTMSRGAIRPIMGRAAAGPLKGRTTLQGLYYRRICFTTFPCTSVNRKARP